MSDLGRRLSARKMQDVFSNQYVLSIALGIAASREKINNLPSQELQA